MFKKTEQTPREVILVRSVCAHDFTFIDKWSSRIVGFFAFLCLLAALFVAWIALFYEPTTFKPVVKDYQKRSPSSPVQSTENLRSGDPNSQVIGDHLGGLDRPDVRVGEERGAGELQP